MGYHTIETTNTEGDSRQRAWLGIFSGALAVVGAVLSAVATGTGTGSIIQIIESTSAVSSNMLGALATVLPLGYAFGAGMVASINPCGFALLPAYLGLYLSTGNSPSTAPPLRWSVLQAIRVSAIMTTGFIVLFGVAGIGVSLATTIIARYLPWLGLLIGLLLIVGGSRMLSGAGFYSTFGEQLAGRLGANARQSNSRGYFAYGLAYGAASLSCTLPIFLSVVGGTIMIGSIGAAIIQFVLYALGMGFVISLLTISMAFVKLSLVMHVRDLRRYVEPASALLLLFAGAFIVYYWLTQGGLLATLL